ncbi:hypothetical protein BX661DRAFT_196849 [Kickxella alabastrina]|uniref:uncharacterized protein n=1 Tax=Kickxella alabastrina TaxID=61397 RepID=UPI00221ED52D|nr:uncharacterized protein BX661DRAFT_196849 [Kickxella alabastrina]KAI7832968.1 hypothetical protein BX661DRAFT_196849 [Kickxella alabastrina]
MATNVKVYANNFLDTPLEVSGFGFENLSNGMNTDELTKVDMKVGSDEYCKQIVEEYSYDYLICTERDSPLFPAARHPTNIKDVLHDLVNVFDINESSTNPIVTQLGAAVTELISAYGKDNQEKVDEDIMSAVFESPSANNDPEYASELAAHFISGADRMSDAKKPFGGYYSSMGLVMNELSVAINVSTILDKIIGFIITLRTIMPGLFDDAPTGALVLDNNNNTPNTNSLTATSGRNTGTKTKPETETETRADVVTETVTEIETEDETGSQMLEKASANFSRTLGGNSKASESSSSSAVSNSHITTGVLSIDVITGVITAFF